MSVSRCVRRCDANPHVLLCFFVLFCFCLVHLLLVLSGLPPTWSLFSFVFFLNSPFRLCPSLLFPRLGSLSRTVVKSFFFAFLLLLLFCFCSPMFIPLFCFFLLLFCAPECMFVPVCVCVCVCAGAVCACLSTLVFVLLVLPRLATPSPFLEMKKGSRRGAWSGAHTALKDTRTCSCTLWQRQLAACAPCLFTTLLFFLLVSSRTNPFLFCFFPAGFCAQSSWISSHLFAALCFSSASCALHVRPPTVFPIALYRCLTVSLLLSCPCMLLFSSLLILVGWPQNPWHSQNARVVTCVHVPAWLCARTGAPRRPTSLLVLLPQPCTEKAPAHTWHTRRPPRRPLRHVPLHPTFLTPTYSLHIFAPPPPCVCVCVSPPLLASNHAAHFPPFRPVLSTDMLPPLPRVSLVFVLRSAFQLFFFLPPPHLPGSLLFGRRRSACRLADDRQQKQNVRHTAGVTVLGMPNPPPFTATLPLLAHLSHCLPAPHLAGRVRLRRQHSPLPLSPPLTVSSRSPSHCRAGVVQPEPFFFPFSSALPSSTVSPPPLLRPRTSRTSAPVLRRLDSVAPARLELKDAQA